MKQIIAFIVTFWPFILFGQNSIFSIDSSDVLSLSRDFKKNEEKIRTLKEMEWKINNKSLFYESQSISIKSQYNKLDTIFFRENKLDKWDTIICKINKPGHYRLQFNECCGLFNVYNDQQERPTGLLKMKIKEISDKTFLGTFGTNSFIVTSNPTKIKGEKGSAMESSCKLISLSEIKLLNNGQSSDKTSIYSNDKVITYTIISKKLQFYYLPLDNELIEVSYNSKTGKAIIK